MVDPVVASLDELVDMALEEALMTVGKRDKRKGPWGAERRKQARRRNKPRHINKIKSISARCKECGTLIVMRVEWRPIPLNEFVEELLETVKVCHNCGRQLGKLDWSRIRLTMTNEDDTT